MYARIIVQMWSHFLLTFSEASDLSGLVLLADAFILTVLAWCWLGGDTID